MAVLAPIPRTRVAMATRERSAGRESPDSLPVHAAGVLVDAASTIEVVEREVSLADQEVVDDEDSRDGAEEAGVADEPDEDVGPVVLEELPGHHGDADDARQDP